MPSSRPATPTPQIAVEAHAIDVPATLVAMGYASFQLVGGRAIGVRSDTPAGPVLGEITFYPGTFFYKNRKLMAPEEAVRLGAMWGVAEKRLAGSLLAPAPKPN